MKEYFGGNAIHDAKVHAAKEFPKEICGIIFDSKYVPLTNIHETPESDFRIDPEIYIAFQREGDIEAMIHSHNDFPHASMKDQEAQINTALPWGVINLVKGNVIDVFFWGDQLPKQNLIGRPFYFGVYDCYSLARDWYALRFDVDIPDVPRQWDYWRKGKSLYEDNLHPLIKSGEWRIIKDKTKLQPGDGLLFKLFKCEVWNHGAIYVGNNLIAHHLENRLSRTEPVYNWLRSLDTVVRPVKLEGK